MDQEITRMATDPEYRKEVTKLIRENLNEGLSTLSGSQLSYVAGRFSGRTGTTAFVPGYWKGASMLGDYYHGVSRAGAGIASITEFIAFGESIESIDSFR